MIRWKMKLNQEKENAQNVFSSLYLEQLDILMSVKDLNPGLVNELRMKVNVISSLR